MPKRSKVMCLYEQNRMGLSVISHGPVPHNTQSASHGCSFKCGEAGSIWSVVHARAWLRIHSGPGPVVQGAIPARG
jgi:hypothetical protein